MVNNLYTEKGSRQVLDNLVFPIWIKDLEGEFIDANNAFKNIYKLGKSNLGCIKACEKCYVKKLCEDSIQKTIKTKASSNFELVIEDRIYQCYITPYLDEDNNMIGTMGTLIDLTDMKEKQKIFEERENILRTIIDTLPEYIFYKNKDCRYIGYNKKWEEHYHSLGIGSMIGKNDIEAGAVSRELAQKFIQQDKVIMQTKKMMVTERKIKQPDGSERVEETIKVPVIDDDGQVWGIVGLASDVTEKNELKEKLMKLSYTDSLTGAYNRACFEEKKEELNKNQYLPIGVIMGDVNGLKVINDTFGHLEGDKLLKEIANILTQATRKEDFIFRWGGDEFVILMPNCDEKKCEETITNIIKECKKRECSIIEMSIALGSSIKNCLGEDIYINLQEAEEKLYRQKFLNSRSIRSSVIFSLNQSLQEKNVETEQHTHRVVSYALKIGKKLGFTTAQLDELELTTKLHDIGKIGISEEILLKPGRLTDDEFSVIKSHTEKGYRILTASNELSHVARSVLTHHERYCGDGYPLGLKGEEIPIMARIVNVVDSYDSMISDRGYNKIKSMEEAMEELIRCKGTQFDPKITDIFIDILRNQE